MYKWNKTAIAAIITVCSVVSLSSCGRDASTSTDSDAVTTLDSSKASGEINIWAMGA